MFESEIESCIEFVVSGIDSGEDTETLEETLKQIRVARETGQLCSRAFGHLAIRRRRYALF